MSTPEWSIAQNPARGNKYFIWHWHATAGRYFPCYGWWLIECRICEKHPPETFKIGVRTLNMGNHWYWL
jgi:hypothetical protein